MIGAQKRKGNIFLRLYSFRRGNTHFVGPSSCITNDDLITHSIKERVIRVFGGIVISRVLYNILKYQNGEYSSKLSKMLEMNMYGFIGHQA